MQLQVRYSICWKFMTILLPVVILLQIKFNLAISKFHLQISDSECLTDVIHLPAELNSTLECSVSLETTQLIWEFNHWRSNDVIQREYLSDSGFYAPSESMITSGETSTTMVVYGSLSRNGSEICCLLIERTRSETCCTTTIIYGPPLTPIIKAPTTLVVGAVNISWSASEIESVNQSYIVIINSTSNAEAIISGTPLQHYIFNTPDSKSLCDTFVATVKAVNGAGESNLSNEVTFVVPSLPDIVPVSMSLRHEVWKIDGEIVIRLSFEPASSCMAYPTTMYLIELKSAKLSMRTSLIPLNASDDTLIDNLTVYLGPDVLEENHQYVYRVTAVNNVGHSTSEEKRLMTSDVEFISAEFVAKNILIIRCYLINGSDAQGCRVVLVSDLPNIENMTKEFYSSQSERVVQGHLNISLDQVSCYHQMFAYDIELDFTISNLAIEGNLTLPDDEVCFGSRSKGHIPSVALGIVLTLIMLLVIIITSILILILLLRTKNCSTTRSLKLHNCLSAHSPIIYSTSSGLKDSPVNTIAQEAGLPCQGPVIPLYAVPNKHKAPSNKSCSHQIENSTANDSEVEHVYHILVNNRVKDSGDVILRDPDAPELPPPLKQSSSPPVYQEINELSIRGADMDIETQDNTSYNIDCTQTIIDDLHTEPEKTIQS